MKNRNEKFCLFFFSLVYYITFLFCNRCKNNQCIPSSEYCDHEYNCFDKSDEICTKHKNTLSYLKVILNNITIKIAVKKMNFSAKKNMS